MSEEELTLEGQAVEEILKEAKRSKELIRDFGTYGLKKRETLPNKRFLNNTLVSTLKHGYREERKHRDGSYKKYKQHMSDRRGRGRGFYKNRGDKTEEVIEEDINEPEPDYGEFDAIAYSDKCTDLYIRDSHRKHFFMRANFVEKLHKNTSSESEESYTEYDDPPPAEEKWQHDRFEQKWSDTGSADEHGEGLEPGTEQSSDIETKRRHDRGKRPIRGDNSSYEKHHKHDKHTQEKSNWNLKSNKRSHKNASYSERGSAVEKYDWRERDLEQAGTSGTYNNGDNDNKRSSDSENSQSEREPTNSGTESADNIENHKEVKRKGRNRIKLPNDGKELWEKISSRSMYADIEEMKMNKKEPSVGKKSRFEDRGFERKINPGHQERMLLEKEERSKREHLIRKQEYLQRKEEESKRKEEFLNRVAYQKRKEEERQREREVEEEVMRRLAEKEWKEEQMRRAAYESYMVQGHHPRRPYRGRPFFRGRPPYRGRPPRGFGSGFPIFPPINPFYASFLQEMDPYLLGKFIKEHGHKLLKKSKRRNSRSSSRSRSYSRSKSGKSKRKKRHYSSSSDRSYSRDRDRSYSRDSRSRSRSRRRSSSRSRTRSRSKTRSKSRSRSSGYSGSRGRSRKHSNSYSRSKRHSSSERSRSRSPRSRSRSKSHRSRSRSRNHRSRSKSEYSRTRNRSHSEESKSRHRSHSVESRKHSDTDSSERSRSHSSKKHKKSRKHKKSKNRKHSKSGKRKHKSRKSSESHHEEDTAGEKSEADEEITADADQNSENNSGKNEEGEIVSDDGLENVSEEASGDAWSTSVAEESD